MSGDVITFTQHQHGDGALTVTADNWPQSLRVSEQLLDEADASMLCRVGNTIVITVANGRAVYRILGEAQPDVLLCERVESTMATASRATERR
jgi:hypothetical protein